MTDPCSASGERAKGVKLTKVQLKALRWIADNEPVKWWPVDGGVSRQIRNRLLDRGLTHVSTPGACCLHETRLTTAGRSALSDGGSDAD